MAAATVVAAAAEVAAAAGAKYCSSSNSNSTAAASVAGSVPDAYIRSVTNFLADVTMCCCAATAEPCLGGTSAAPFLGAHDPDGHFL